MVTSAAVVARIGLLPSLSIGRPRPEVLWTLVGASAIPMWATWPLVAAMTGQSMPLFQYMAVLFAAGAASLWTLQRLAGASGRGGRGAEPGPKGSAWLAAAMVCVGILLSDILFLLAIRHIPAAEANLLLYLWPVMVVLLALVLGLARLRLRDFLGVALGLVGAGVVFGVGDIGLSWTGALLALGGGLVWAAYVVFRMWQGPNAPDALARGLCLSAVVATALHLGFETWVQPPTPALLAVIAVGVVPLGIGNLAWDHGVRKGDRVFLSTIAYATPLLSALFLVAAGFATLTTSLALGAALIVAAGLVASRRAAQVPCASEAARFGRGGRVAQRSEQTAHDGSFGGSDPSAPTTRPTSR